MSAWIVQNESINNIVNSIYCGNYNEYFKSHFSNLIKEKFKIDFDCWEDEKLNEELKNLGQILVNLNNESVNYRYNEKTKPFKFEFSNIKPLNVYQFLMSIKCLSYQSCEIENYQEDERYKLLIELENNLKDCIISPILEEKKVKWE